MHEDSTPEGLKTQLAVIPRKFSKILNYRAFFCQKLVFLHISSECCCGFPVNFTCFYQNIPPWDPMCFSVSTLSTLIPPILFYAGPTYAKVDLKRPTIFRVLTLTRLDYFKLRVLRRVEIFKNDFNAGIKRRKNKLSGS